MTDRHTPGPWHAVKAIHRNDTIGVFSGENKLIYMTRDEADARLISAAPDLLEALKAVRNAGPMLGGELGAQVDAAIAEAEKVAA